MPLTGALGENQMKVYAAESSLNGAKFTDLSHIQEWVDSLVASDWWEKRFAYIKRIDVIEMPEKNLSCSIHTSLNTATIAISLSMMDCFTVCHEIAHCVSAKDDGHSSDWARRFLEIAYLALGSEKYVELYEAFMDCEVDF